MSDSQKAHPIHSTFASIMSSYNDDESIFSIEPELIKWIRDRVVLTGFKSDLWCDQFNVVVADFLSSKTVCRLFLYFDSDKLCVSTNQISNIANVKQVQFFLKNQAQTIFSIEKLEQSVHYATIEGTPLDSLLRLMDKIYLPVFLNHQTWPDSVRKDFSAQLHKFMASLTDTANQSRGHTVLYLPNEDLSSPSKALNDKELIQRLESALIHWTRQIKDVVSTQESSRHVDNTGPLEEISFWRSRCIDLQSIQSQLERKEVRDIVDVLSSAQSSYLKPYQNFFNMIERGSHEAKDNLKFLRTLQEPCERLALADPCDIPAILPEILNRIRMIWTLSKFYNKEEPLTGLLRKVSNQLILQCSSKIDLNQIFSGCVEVPITRLQESIVCGVAWKDLFHRTAKAIAARARGKAQWNFEPSSIFAQIDAFVQRCRDLLEVCDGQIQFARRRDGQKRKLPAFGGIRGPSIERSLHDIEEAFEKLVGRLRQLPYNILDVKATKWHDHYSAFSNGVKDLEVMMTNVISSAFECSATVKSGLALLAAFHHLTKRPNLKNAIEKRTADVWLMFFRDVKGVKAHFDRHKNRPHIPLTQPQSSGGALWAQGLMARLTEQYSALEDAKAFLIPVREAEEASFAYQHLTNGLSDYIAKSHEKWTDEIKKVEDNKLAVLLEKPLLIRVENPVTSASDPPSHLESNFDKTLIRLFNEVRCWEKFKGEFAIPLAAYEISSQSERLRILNENILLVVRTYNTIINNLSQGDEKRTLFREHLRRVDQIIMPGLETLCWSSDNINTYVEDCRRACQEVHDIVLSYRSNYDKVRAQCRKIASSSVIDFVKNQVYDVPFFQCKQVEHQQIVRKELLAAHNDIASSMEATYLYFESHGQEVQKEWLRYVLRVDEEIEHSLLQTVKKSLNELNHAILPSVRQEQHPVFKLAVQLDPSRAKSGNMIIFNPSLTELSETLQIVCNDIVSVAQVVPRLSDVLSSKGKFKPELDSTLTVPIPVKTLTSSPCSTSKLFFDSAPHSSFYDKIIASVKDIIREIVRTLENIHPELSNLIQVWVKYQERVWHSDQDAYLRRFDPQRNWPLSTYDARIEEKRSDKDDIISEESVYNAKFIKLDFSQLKQTLITHCDQWHFKLTGLLHTKTIAELESLRNLFTSNSEVLSKKPQTLDELGNSLHLLEDLKKQLPSIQARFAPLEQMCNSLEKFDVDVAEEKKEREVLVDEFQDFQDTLMRVEYMLSERKIKMKKDLELDMNIFNHHVIETRQDFLKTGPFDAPGVTMGDPDCEVALKFITDYRKNVSHIKNRANEMRRGLGIFDIEIPRFKEADDTLKDLDQLEEIWVLTQKWVKHWTSWRQTSFSALDPKEMDNVAHSFQKDVHVLGRTMKAWKVWQALKERVEEFRVTMPLISDLKNPAMRDRHWNQFKAEISQYNFDPHAATFTLDVLTKMNIHHYAEIIKHLANTAQKELTIEEDLLEIKNVWDVLEFEMVRHKSKYYKLRSVEELFEYLERHQMNLSTMKNSPFFHVFQNDITHWVSTLNEIEKALELITTVQRQWMYLESIFVGTDDLQKQLAAETTLFEKVNRQWVELSTKFAEEKNVQSCCLTEGVADVFKGMDRILTKIQKSLEDYLETKRNQFPRFYFLSNDDLLEILGHTKDPMQVQKHIKNCFAGIHHLDIQMGARCWEARGMFDSDGEHVDFLYPVTCDGPVERWLKRVEKCMRDTLRKLLQTAYKKIEPRLAKSETKEELKNRRWIDQTIGQLVILASQVAWTEDCESAIRDVKKKRPLRSLAKRWSRYLTSLTEMIHTDLNHVNRKKLATLLTIEVHAREVIDYLHKAEARWAERKINGVESWDWRQQLRFEYQQGQHTEGDWGQVVIHQTNTSFDYGYEYQGNSDRLVITQLTDRCYMTLTTALHMKRGGNPQGPAGTGKTETVKDLGKALGKYVVVFNCSDKLDYRSLGRMFSGLAQTGSWGCFDEFNRIEVEVLSVVGLQIHTILSATIEGVEMFAFEGRQIPLDRTCGIFITMNPSSKSYTGRSELPDNVKSLFRPVAMMVPDFARIAQVMLFAEGFESAPLLSRKITTLYSLMQQQFSKQFHYDFGLRSIKSVLRQAGLLHRHSKKAKEDEILMKALRDMNLPKFVSEDINLFFGLIQDLFPALDLPSTDAELLEKECRNQLRLLHLQENSTIIHKVIQLYDTMNTRHGNMMVGEAGSGKTTTWTILRNSFNALHAAGHKFPQVETFILNPKALDIGELYGHFDVKSREWYPGILSTVMKRVCEEEAKSQKWIILDGPVDTLWIESMNSVLDDSKVLTLINGDRIKLPNNVALLFEVADLSVASPATVSRAGMVYFNLSELGWQPYVDSWLSKFTDKDVLDFLTKSFSSLIPRLLAFKRDNCKELVPIQDFNAIQSFCQLFDSINSPANGIDAKDKDRNNYLSMIINAFYFCLVWSIGGSVDEAGRDSLNEFIRSNDAPFPPLYSVYDYFIDPRRKEWVTWEEAVPKQWSSRDLPFDKMLVDTVDTVRHKYLLDRLISNHINTLVVGRTGTGKSALISSIVSSLDERIYSTMTIIFSAATKSRDLQFQIERRLERRQRNNWGPKGGRPKMVVFIDELNMPTRDVSSQPPLELLRQWLSYGSWYARDSASESGHGKQGLRNIRDVQIIAAMGPPGGAREVICGRIKSKFNLLHFTTPADSQILRIYSTILNDRFSTFDEGIRPLSNIIAEATIELYNQVSENLLPTPSKSHYVFNLRDISKVVQGLSRADRTNYDSRNDMIRLWVHECTRVFNDRLIDVSDRALFKELLGLRLQNSFGVSYDALLRMHVPLFADFVVEKDYIESKMSPYVEVPSIPALKHVLEDKIESMTIELRENVDLVLFDDAVEHLCRICRVLELPRGHCLLVGVGGSGRHSLTKLASFIASANYYTIDIKKGYSKADFYDDLRALFYNCAINDKKTVFCFSDSQIVEDAFLEDINNILTSGEVPGLYLAGSDEYNAMIEHIRTKADVNGKPTDNADVLYAYFHERVRSNLHLVLCFSPAGDGLRDNCRMYPSLVNNTTIDWFSDWPESALKEVATRTLLNVDLGSEEIKDGLCEVFTSVHQSVIKANAEMMLVLNRHNYVTPMHYLELVKSFRSLLAEKRKAIGHQADILRHGLSRLDDSHTQVAEMRLDLEDRKKRVKQKQHDCSKLLEEIIRKKHVAEESKTQVMHDKERIELEKGECQQIEEKATIQLKKAMPKLEAANHAVDQLDSGSIVEVRSYLKPHVLIEKVMCCVMVLFGKEPTWVVAKRELGDNFVTRIKNFPKDNIPNPVIKAVSKFTKHKDFNPDSVREKSVAAGAICEWVLAIEYYAEVAKEIAPLRLQLQEANSSLRAKITQLKGAESNLAQVTEMVAKLQEAYNKSEQDKNQLTKEAEELEIKLERAASLVEGLADERVRWEYSIADYSHQLGYLVGDCAIASSYISYAGPFPSEYRASLYQYDWKKAIRSNNLPFSTAFQLSSFLSDPLDIQNWRILGLPSDDFSTENGILVTRARRWPLMIDPHGQANKWIKKLVGTNLRVLDLKSTDSEVTVALEKAVSYGTAVLIEDVGISLDNSLDPILLAGVSRASGDEAASVKISNERSMTISADFRFYMTTRLQNPHYSPENCTKLTLVNFAVKAQGLEEQLLGVVVQFEQPELENQKIRLVRDVAEGRKSIKKLEREILEQLSGGGSSSLLDDDVTINTLRASKSNSETVQANLKISEETEKEIDGARENYRSCASNASLLFFVLDDMSRIDPMYQFSLESYIDLFVRSIENSRDPKSQLDLKDRVTSLNRFHTEAVYRYSCTALFVEHKLMLAFLITTHRMQSENKLNSQEYDFFLRGGIAVDEQKNPCDEWLPDNSWVHIIELDKLPAFKNLASSFEANQLEWRRWYLSNDPQPEKAQLPGDWSNKLDDFQHMVVLRCLRPDRVIFAARHFVINHLGPQFVEPPEFNISKIHQSSSPLVPIIFILSPGVDPYELLVSYSQEENVAVHQLSMGQGQQEKAEKLIELGCENGFWVFLANVHLSIKWLPSLVKLLAQKAETKPHPNFRLWMSSNPHPDFPISLLQNGVKVTTEPPSGIKANMTRLLNMFKEDTLQERCTKPFEYKKLLFSLCWFHSILLERRKFQNLGWNIPYDFNDSDFQVCENIIALYLDTFTEVPLEAIKYLICEACYGGRVTDDRDRKLLRVYANQYFNEQVITQPNYRLSALGAYFIPNDGPLSIFKDYVKQFLPVDDPEAFGQHSNADIASQKERSFAMLNSVLSLRPKALISSSDGSGSENSILKLIEELQNKIPQPLDYNTISKKYENDNSPLKVVLLQEISRYNSMLETIHFSLIQLKRGIMGSVVISPDLEDVYNSLILGKIPPRWKTMYPSVKPIQSWTLDLIARIDQMSKWADVGTPKVFWLGGFTFPSGFLTALMQTLARHSTNVSIDSLTWEFVVTNQDEKSITQQPREGAYIKGLFLEGAKWDYDTGCMADSSPMELLFPMPIIHFKPILTKNKKKIKGTYACPLYLYPVRESMGDNPTYILSVELRANPGKDNISSIDSDHWAKRGAALLLSTET